MNIAVQLFTLKKFVQTPEDIAASLKRVKEIGYNAVQVSAVGPIDDQALKGIADQNGLTICATHIPYTQLTENLEAVIEKHRVWDCSYVGLGSIPPQYRDSLEGYLTFAQQANEIGKRLADAGLSFIYHNHNFEFTKLNGRLGMDILLEETDPRFVGFELDMYWVQAGGADPAEWIRKVKGRMKVAHFKDMMIYPEREQRFAEVGEGNMNYAAIVEACRSTGVEWAAVEQDNCYDKDPFECLATSYRNLRQLGLS
ncbi:sugar phosphate isomerase/epimerase family protein [Paenibacillus silviterrae]|uniref:sugar phosphate isomerase/epimerase family protein n=1 Tax=Paenibacillus silviterrae TaxID=3242194 RepID=UPI002543F390|nr:sugar phosphate isomerase/epimerase [Paenibacillus chinjuensis]